MRTFFAFLFQIVSVLGIYCAIPLAIVFGWIRWGKSKTERVPFVFISLTGFVLATCSAALAFGSMIYATVVAGPSYSDSFLTRVDAWGGLLALFGTGVGLLGCWRRGPLRWHAPLCAFGMLVFWFMAAMGE